MSKTVDLCDGSQAIKAPDYFVIMEETGLPSNRSSPYVGNVGLARIRQRH